MLLSSGYMLFISLGKLRVHLLCRELLPDLAREYAEQSVLMVVCVLDVLISSFYSVLLHPCND